METKRRSLFNPWKGYAKPRTLGKWFVIDWPDEHPDTHCEEGKYTPKNDEAKACVSCKWVPQDSRDSKGEDLREVCELDCISELVERNHLTPVFLIRYLAYVDLLRDTLRECPRFDDVKVWWDHLTTTEKETYQHRYIRFCKPEIAALFTQLP